eukprot:1849788-Rhodomonas_salina.1
MHIETHACTPSLRDCHPFWGSGLFFSFRSFSRLDLIIISCPSFLFLLFWGGQDVPGFRRPSCRFRRCLSRAQWPASTRAAAVRTGGIAPPSRGIALGSWGIALGTRGKPLWRKVARVVGEGIKCR